MSELACTFAEFKRRTMEGIRMIRDGVNEDERENIKKIVGLSYLNISDDTDMNMHQAAIVLTIFFREIGDIPPPPDLTALKRFIKQWISE